MHRPATSENGAGRSRKRDHSVYFSTEDEMAPSPPAPDDHFLVNEQQIQRAARDIAEQLRNIAQLLCLRDRKCQHSRPLNVLNHLTNYVSESTQVTSQDCAEVETGACYVFLRIILSTPVVLSELTSTIERNISSISDLPGPAIMLFDAADQINDLMSASTTSQRPLKQRRASTACEVPQPGRLWQVISESSEKLDKQICSMGQREIHQLVENSGHSIKLQDIIDGQGDTRSTRQEEHFQKGLKELVRSTFCDPGDYLAKFGQTFGTAYARSDTIYTTSTLDPRSRGRFAGLRFPRNSISYVQDLLSCSAWWLDQLDFDISAPPWSSLELNQHLTRSSRPHLSQSPSVCDGHWEQLWKKHFPDRDRRRHFALRATYCAIASFRPLDIKELFAAATTQVLVSDPVWSTQSSSRPAPKDLLALCKSFLEVDALGKVRIKAVVRKTLIREPAFEIQNAHYFLALVCVTHMKQMQESDLCIITAPWTCYDDIGARHKAFPLKKYVAKYGLHHYQRAESAGVDLPRRLHHVLEIAFDYERSSLVRSLQIAQAQLLGPKAHQDALDRGLRFCKAYNLDQIVAEYHRLGAKDVPQY